MPSGRDIGPIADRTQCRVSVEVADSVMARPTVTPARLRERWTGSEEKSRPQVLRRCTTRRRFYAAIGAVASPAKT